MTIFRTNNPGIGGLDELTSSEEAIIASLASLGSAGQVLTVNSAGDGVEWGTVSGGGGGGGDVSASANFGSDNVLIRSDGSLKGVQSSGISVSDTDDVSGLNSLTIDEIAAPATPASGSIVIYAKADGKLYIKDDTGTETDLTEVGGSGSTTITNNAVFELAKGPKLYGYLPDYKPRTEIETHVGSWVTTHGKLWGIWWENYRFNSDGTLLFVDDTEAGVSNMGFTASNLALVKTYADNVFVTVSGDTTGGAAAMMNDSTKRTNAINSIVSHCTTNGLQGVNINFEPISSISGSLKTNFLTFMEDLATQLHSNNLLLSWAGQMRWDPDEPGKVYSGTDYASDDGAGLLDFTLMDLDSIGVDILESQCYDQFYDFGAESHDLTSLDQVESTIEYFKSRVPQKTAMILPTYAVQLDRGDVYGGVTTNNMTRSQVTAVDATFYTTATRNDDSQFLEKDVASADQILAVDQRAIDIYYNQCVGNGVEYIGLWLLGDYPLPSAPYASTADADARVVTAYNTQVAQVSTAEKTAGTETDTRRFSPDDVKDMIETHAGSGGGISNVVEDTTPQLGGDLDADQNSITDVLGIDVTELTVGGTFLRELTFQQAELRFVTGASTGGGNVVWEPYSLSGAETVSLDGSVDILDVENGEGIRFSVTTGRTPKVEAAGADTNIDLNLVPKGSGEVQVNGEKIIDESDVDDTPVDGATTAPVSSNWAFDHDASTAEHGATGAVMGTTNTQTVINKRITPRIGTVASSATPTPAGDSNDQFNITALSVNATIAAPTGTPTDGQKLIIRILDNGTTRTLAYNAIYRAIGVTLPTATTASKTIALGCIYNSADSKWDVVAVAEEA